MAPLKSECVLNSKLWKLWISIINDQIPLNINFLEIVQQADEMPSPHWIFLHPSNDFLPALGALAAYNKGTINMAPSYQDVDDHTTGKDYSNDVTARAQYYEEHLF